jgi:hypothetical protein
MNQGVFQGGSPSIPPRNAPRSEIDVSQLAQSIHCSTCARSAGSRGYISSGPCLGRAHR